MTSCQLLREEKEGEGTAIKSSVMARGCVEAGEGIIEVK